MISYKVYIIRSISHQKFYTGISKNVEMRLHYHNLGKNKSTRPYIPYTLIWESEPMTKTFALILERKIKKRGAKRYLLDHKIITI